MIMSNTAKYPGIICKRFKAPKGQRLPRTYYVYITYSQLSLFKYRRPHEGFSLINVLQTAPSTQRALCKIHVARISRSAIVKSRNKLPPPAVSHLSRATRGYRVIIYSYAAHIFAFSRSAIVCLHRENRWKPHEFVSACLEKIRHGVTDQSKRAKMWRIVRDTQYTCYNYIASWITARLLLLAVGGQMSSMQLGDYFDRACVYWDDDW